MNINKIKIKAVLLTILFLLGTTFLVTADSLPDDNDIYSAEKQVSSDNEDTSIVNDPLEYRILDRNYKGESEPQLLSGDSTDDAGYRRDASNSFSQAKIIYPCEPVDHSPGRGNTGTLSSYSDKDWYFFFVFEGQHIVMSLTPPSGEDFALSLWDKTETEVAISDNPGDQPEYIDFVATYSGRWYMEVYATEYGTEGQYTFEINLLGQNDADSGDDAGNTFATATLISPGDYDGYMDMNDENDWYKFIVEEDDGIHLILTLNMAPLSDFDVTLYNPDGKLVHRECKYLEDELLYPGDVAGEWRAKIDIFPGYADMPDTLHYYKYGSGIYHLTFTIETSAPDPVDPIPQPDITPIAKTFIIANDPDSNKDEYGYIASIPACNYLEGGDRYLAPIVYEGDETNTNWYDTDEDCGTVDDTTHYLIEDWNAYLESHGKTAEEYTVPNEPVTAAAEIAQENWESTDLAVVVVDGSGYEDTVKQVLKRTRMLRRKTIVEELPSDAPELQEEHGYAMFLGPRWCAINVSTFDVKSWHVDLSGSFLNEIFPKFMGLGSDFWPTPYDSTGDCTDLYYPVTTMGLWSVGSQLSRTQFSTLRITKYAGHRYKFWVRDPDSTIHVKIETNEPSDLLVFLVDPQGHLRAPDIPYWNGGPIMPIHQWNGFDNETGFDRWRDWNPDPHTEFSAQVLHPEKGLWTAIVVPRNADGPNVRYKITGEVRTISSERADASVSAANAAVIASLEHAPLLYVTEDSVPPETEQAFNELGIDKVIFVERGKIGDSIKDQLPTIEADLTTMQEIIDYIKAYEYSESYITITSIKSGDGYFAPAAMLAAYHGSPILRFGEAPGNPAGMANRIETWRLWAGDYYHGSRSCGHLPFADKPVNHTLNTLIEMIKYLLTGSGELPPFGMDAKRYWNEELHNETRDWIASYGLDLEGQEAYCFVAPRNDIYLPAHSVMLGNNSYAGHIPGQTPAYTSAIIIRNVLYSALIFANPDRDITTSQLMNFPDVSGGYNQWKTNDGTNHFPIASSHTIKMCFRSHGRTYEGHCIWEGHLERMNKGASIMYYSGHGTGGSGVSAQYIQTDHCEYPDWIWWDAWRGYMYDDWKTPRDNHFRWYNPSQEPSGNLYDIIHYTYVDQLTNNLKSNAIFYMSCTTADAYGPMVYLDHGAVMFYGNAGSGLCPEADLMDDEVFQDVMIYGEPVGPAYAKQVWLHYRDFTTCDPTSMYGTSSLGTSSLPPITTVHCIYGDPNLIIYSPEWESPIPIDP